MINSSGMQTFLTGNVPWLSNYLFSIYKFNPIISNYMVHIDDA